MSYHNWDGWKGEDYIILIGAPAKLSGAVGMPLKGVSYNWDGWLVGCFGFNGPLRQYFSLYRTVSQREGERGEKGQMRVKMSKHPPPAPTASAVGPCPTVIQIVGRPGAGSSPSTIAPPDHPRTGMVETILAWLGWMRRVKTILS